jgi:polysaccharide deacetylase 2 family uncharacterized protein YibQ
VAADDLSAPLGRQRKRRTKLPGTLPLVAAGCLSLSLLVFVLWAALNRDPLGGEPVVVMSVDTLGPATKPDEAASAEKPELRTAPAAAPAASAAKGAPPGMQSVTIIDGASGNRQEVLVPSQAPGQPAGQPAAPRAVSGGDQKLLEMTRHGAIPRVAADGARPLTAYARPAGNAKADLPRVALVIGGLGIASSSTAEAMAKLPGPVSFAFVPYASDVDRLATRARGEGHEILLQLPMEPFDFPDNDPGPQTLLTSLAPEQNIDRVHWLMSRFQGYVGIVNYMGARFTASEPAFGPVLREVAKRGLMYVDDGSSPRSLASQLAGSSSLPFVKAEIVLDAVPTPGEIDRALLRLETAARETGLAVGIASALPVSIARIAEWAKKAEARGFALVPISAAAVKPKAS